MPYNFLSPNCKFISVLITPSSGSTLASYTFPEQQDLQNRKIIAITSFCEDDIKYDPLNPSTTVITGDSFNNAFLTLYTAAVKSASTMTRKQETGLFYDKIPLCTLRNVINNNTSGSVTNSMSQTLFLMRPTEIAWTKSSVQYPTPVTGLGATTHSAVFLVHYLDKDDDGSFYMRAMGYPEIHPAR